MMRWIIVAVLMGAFALASRAQAQTDTTPAPSAESSPEIKRPHFDFHDGHRWQKMAEQWPLIEKFMKQYSPQRWQAYVNLPDQQQQKLRNVLRRRYNVLQLIKETQPEAFYNLRLKRMTVEDELFGLTRDWKSASDDDKPQIENKLKAKLGELADMGVKEHQLRIERFKKLIAHEQAQLKYEKSDRGKIIARRLKNIENEHARLGEPAKTSAPRSAPPATQP